MASVARRLTRLSLTSARSGLPAPRLLFLPHTLLALVLDFSRNLLFLLSSRVSKHLYIASTLLWCKAPSVKLDMAQKDWYTNIMLDLECAHVEAPNPVLLELAAVHFDIDTGEEIGHYSTIISYQSCLDKGLVDDIVKVQDGETVKFLDGETTKFLKNDSILALTRLESKASEITLEHALSEFSKFVERSRQMTLRMLGRRNPPRNYTQPMIWGNGAVADNV